MYSFKHSDFLQGVKYVLETLGTRKATGPDSINPTLLKQTSPAFAESLCQLFSIYRSISLHSQTNGKCYP